MPLRRCSSNAETGAMAVAMSGLVAAIAVLSLAVGSVAVLYAARAQAINAADAAALSAAAATYPPADGRVPASVARQVAALNGARLLSCICPRDGSVRPRVVEVTTMISTSVPIFGELSVRAVSRAEFDPRRWLGR